MLNQVKQSGISLIEFLVTITIGVFLILGLTQFAGNFITSNFTTVKSERLGQELRTIMVQMVRDIRRSGYVVTLSNASNFIGVGSSTYSNPYATVSTGVAGCILYAYDASTLGTGSASQQQFGFMLSSSQVLMRTGGTTFNCTQGANNTWSAISDPNVTNITALTFTPTTRTVYISGTSGSNIAIREITITLTGQLKSDSTVQQTLTETVKLSNDQFNPS